VLRSKKYAIASAASAAVVVALFAAGAVLSARYPAIGLAGFLLAIPFYLAILCALLFGALWALAARKERRTSAQ